MCCDFFNLKDQLLELEKIGIDYLHIDIIDGYFAKDFTFGTEIIKQIRSQTGIACDFHFMVKNPMYHLDTFQLRPGDMVSLHIESEINVDECQKYFLDRGVLFGLALSPNSSINTVSRFLDNVGFFNLLCVNPGFKGQVLKVGSFERIAELAELIEQKNKKVFIQADGNMNIKNVPLALKNGATSLVLGSSGLFIQNELLEINFEKIKKVVSKL